jgi:RAD51-like protein 2
VPLGEVTEFVGTPGIGKTQLGIQLAVDAHLPHIFGGAEGEAVYIDTEGSFMSERAFEIAEAFTTHVHKMARIRRAPPRPLPPATLSQFHDAL